VTVCRVTCPRGAFAALAAEAACDIPPVSPMLVTLFGAATVVPGRADAVDVRARRSAKALTVMRADLAFRMA